MSYEVKELVEELKKEGIEAAEGTAIGAVKAVSSWAQKEAAKGEKPIVDAVVLIAAPQLEKVLVELADKINPEG